MSKKNSSIASDDNGKDIYIRLLQYARPHWRMFLISLFGMAGFAAADVSFVGLMRPLLDGSFVDKDPKVIAFMPWLILCLFLLRGVSAFASAYCMAWVGRQVIKALRGEMFQQYLRLPVAFFDQSSSGNLIAKLTYHTEQVAESTTNALTSVVRDGLTVIGLILLMLYLEWRLTLFILAIGPLIAGLVSYVSRRFRKISTRIQDSMGDVTHVAEEAISGQRVIKLYDGADYEANHFGEANESNRRQHLKLVSTRAGSTAMVQFIAAWAVAAIVYVATAPGMIENMTPGTFVAFMGAMMSLLQPLKHLTTVNEKLQRGIAAARDIFGLLQEPPELDAGTLSLEKARGQIEILNLGFGYSRDDKPVLQDITLSIEPGQTVAFVGRSGSGKTSLLSLLPRFYAPTQGQILLDGQDISDYRLDDLRRQFALVDQNITLFNDTVARNIAYGGLSQATTEQLRAAADAAHALEFIEALPHSFDTEVGQNGVLLSGGQRQRLAIARALLKPAPILILDEATSALDTESERAVQAALQALMQGRTTLVIAHRLSTIQGADKIVVMDAGRIVEMGKHDELLAKDGYYANLYNMQFSDA
ncbi:MAG: lipid A export permease/ATP-binding protein MsbA [Oceanococcus sp.]